MSTQQEHKECMLKSQCPAMSKLANRVRCCKPGDGGSCVPPAVLSCGKAPLSGYSFCNASLDTAARVSDLLPRLALRESRAPPRPRGYFGWPQAR